MINYTNLNLLKENKYKFILYILTTFITSFLPIYISLQISHFINQYTKTNLTLLIWIGIYCLTLYIKNYSSIKLITLYKNKLFNLVYHNILIAYKNILSKNLNSTAFSQKLIESIDNVTYFYINSFPNIIINTILISYIFSILLKTNIPISIILCIIILIILFLQLFLKNIIFNKKKNSIELSSIYFESIDTFIKNIEHIKYNHLFEKVYTHVFNYGKRFILSSLSLFNTELIKNNLISILNYLFIALFILFSKDLSFSQIFLITSLLTQIFNYITQINNFIDHYYQYRASKDELTNIELSINQDNNQIIDNIYKVDVTNLVTSKQRCHAINATFIQNEVYLIIGSNGIGKSTFFNTLLAIEKDYTGDIKINDIGLQNIDIQSLFNKSIIYMDQNCDLLEYIDSSNSTITQSKGELQRIFIDTQLVINIKNSLILLDEPTASLDTENKNKLIKKINHLKTSNIIIIISHDSFMTNQPYQKVRF